MPTLNNNYIANPYIIGRSIHEPEKFFGRDDLFRFITDNLENGQRVIVLSGQRRIGKTSILKQIPKQVSQLIEGDKYYFVNLDLQDKSYLTLAEFLYELCEQFIESSGISGSLQIPSIEDFTQNANQLFFGNILPQIYEHLHNKSLVVLLDEFDVFKHGKEFLELLKNHNKTKDKLFCIPVLGSNLDNISNFLDLRESPHKRIGLLPKNDAIELITKPAQSVLEYTQEAIDKIWKLTSGHPYFTQVICNAIFTQSLRNSRFQITNGDVENTTNTALELSEFGLTALWKSLQIPENVVFAIVAFLTEEYNFELELHSSRIIDELNKYGVEIIKSAVSPNSLNSSAVFVVYENANLAIISPTNTKTDLKSSVFFRVINSDKITGQKLAKYVYDNLKLKRVVIFANSQNPSSKSVSEEFTKDFQNLGGKVVQEYSFTSSFFGDMISESVNKHQAEAAMLFPDTENTDNAIEIAKANLAFYKDQDKPERQMLRLLGVDTLYSYDTLLKGDQAVEGMILSVPWFRETPAAKDFAQKSAEIWGGNISWRTATSYDATQAFITALSPNASRTKILENLQTVKLQANETSGDSLQFTEERERQSEPVFVEIKNGQFVQKFNDQYQDINESELKTNK
ncbi:MAG: ABC transporter substrate-binding protein [Sphaerospermopsis sp. SIO1G2]|nr:ABC transporter substrate-binding protein [Sphaerospermopsis sp. SIO1G2]